jgi:hypothetical protein
MLSVTAPANAKADIEICHDSKVIFVASSAAAVNGHSGHPGDIIEPNEFLPAGLNWDPVKGFANCGAVVVDPPPVVVTDPPPVVVPPVVVTDPPPVVVPPVVVPPVVDPPAVIVPQTVSAEVPATVTPAAQTPAPQAATPQAAAVTEPVAQAAGVSVGTNEGFNAQTAAGGTEESITWLAGLGVLLGAGAVVAVRRRSRTESPTAG